jgi:predicted nucleic acid-binding protein
VASYLLDTDTLIDFSKKIEPVASRVISLLGTEHDVGICPVQLTEFFTAVSPSERPQWVAFLQTLLFWRITRASAINAGIERYEFARRRVQLSTADCLTASVARAQRAVVVTSNLRHFPQSDILVISPRQSALS